MRRYAAALAFLPLTALAAPSPAVAVEQDVECRTIEPGSDVVHETDAESLPTTRLGIPAAHALLEDREGLPGAGVSVAVLDSGVHAGSPELLDVVRGQSFANKAELLDHHGTAVAGLIAGKPRGDRVTGIAPGARIVDVRVYDDSEQPEEGALDVDTARVAAGLRWVAEQAGALDIKVATVALRVADLPVLRRAVAAAVAADVVVVAASGNRPDDEADELYATYGTLQPGEDARDDIHPAGYDAVVAVNATAAGHPEETNGFDVRSEVLQNSATDVAAPTYGAVSVGVNGGTCLLYDVATSWAAAEVSGVLALLRARYDDDTAAQAVARLEQTAGGSPDDVNVLTGAGVVQPVEALTRPLTPDPDGDVDRAGPDEGTVSPAAPPRPQVDLLAAAREDAVWWGLLGGGLVVLALLLRPLLDRRRP